MSTMRFRIEPFEIKKTAVELEIQNVVLNGENALVNYTLWDNEDRTVAKAVEISEVTVPKAAVNIVTAEIIDITAFNGILAQWNMTATEQITPE